ncbi:MAG: 1-acyl-sn-glycerol-3-phosphate acyltransferase [Verrucomicrobiae bacterium]|nr:1-acyl-sn-glycerol-3-phosphate acyltransferase [Verrucomicrobiae bacterium]
MLDFSDAPYRYFPPKPSRALMWLGGQVNRRRLLPSPAHRVAEIRLEGEAERARELARRGERLLFVANHPTHSDPQVMVEIQRRLGARTCFMAAYDVFLRGKLQAWIMQRSGAFSVDRDGGDRRAMAAALEILGAGRFGLTIFPEGNVYLTNDRVTPFLEGAAFLGLKARKELSDPSTLHVVPVSLKYTHLTDVRGAVRARLAEVSRAVGEAADPDADPVDELLRTGRRLLTKHLRQRGYLSRAESLETEDGHIVEVIKEGIERIVAGLEDKIDLQPKPADGLIERIRRIRGAIHQIRVDPERECDHRVAASWADEAILAFRMWSYASPYVTENPTLDRYAETVEKIAEDHYSRWSQPFGPRRLTAHIGEPADLSLSMEEFSRKARNAVNALTRSQEETIQGGLDAVNAANDCEGGAPF